MQTSEVPTPPAPQAAPVQAQGATTQVWMYTHRTTGHKVFSVVRRPDGLDVEWFDETLMQEVPAAQPAEQAQGAMPDDFLSHQNAWRSAIAELASKDDSGYWPHELRAFDRAYAELTSTHPAQPAEQAPIDMLLYCPNCGMQHVDAPERDLRMDYAVVEGLAEVSPGYAPWANPPHRSHLCHGCSTIWRPADVPTNGVASIKTQGKADTWPAHNEEVRAQPAEHKKDSS